MKPIPINLASHEYIDRRLAYRAMASAVGVILVMTILNGYLHRKYTREISDSQEKIHRITRLAEEKKTAAETKRAAVGEGEIDSARRHAAFVNRLIVTDAFPWTRVLDAFEDRMPEDMVLDRLDTGEQFSPIVLAGYARSMSSVSAYLKAKEETDLFSKVELVTITVAPEPEASENPPVQFEMESALNFKALFPEERYGALHRLFGTPPGKEGK